MNYKELEERPYIDSFHYIEYLGEKIEDRKLIKINRFLQEERKKKDLEIERLNNIIKEAQEYLRSATHLLLEYNKPFRKVGKYEEQYCKRESDLKRILKGEKVEWGIILDKGE